MDKPITVAFRWSAEEMLLVQRLVLRYSPLGSKLRRISLGGGLCLFVMGAVHLPNGKPAFRVFGIACLLLSAGFLAIPLIMRRAGLKMYAQKPDRDMLITYELSSDRLVCRSEIASSDLLWRAIRKVLRTPEGFLLYLTENTAHWLPVRGFEDPADVERFAQFAQSIFPKYDQVAGGKLLVSPAAPPDPDETLKKCAKVWLLLVVFMLVALGREWNSFRKLVARGKQVEGTVSELFPGDATTVRYKFEVESRKYQGLGPVGPPNAPAGQLQPRQNIVVYYDPVDPRNSTPGEPAPMLRQQTISVAVRALAIPTLLVGAYLLAFSCYRALRSSTKT